MLHCKFDQIRDRHKLIARTGSGNDWVNMSETKVLCSNLDEGIDEYLWQGYRLEMIVPSDAPREVLMSKAGDTIRLCSKNRQRSSNATWVTGRAGMMYCDLIPGRLGGKVVASHIRILNGGEVADYVHYHKIRFQVIYCLKGLIKVVYEDQGEPFWLNPGDCVLQPPEIRHRVLEAEANSEVIEITAPAVHETWTDHEMKLPTERIVPTKEFSGQRFVRHIAAEADWKLSGNADILVRHTEISNATGELADVRVLRAVSDGSLPVTQPDFAFYFVLKGSVRMSVGGNQEQEFTSGDGFVVPTDAKCDSRIKKKSEIVYVSLGKYLTAL